jgi:hypothetical protein
MLVTCDGEVVAELVPVRLEPGAAARPRGSKRHKQDESLLRLIGIAGTASGADDGVHDVAENHDRYLAEAHADTHK